MSQHLTDSEATSLLEQSIRTRADAATSSAACEQRVSDYRLSQRSASLLSSTPMRSLPTTPKDLLQAKIDEVSSEIDQTEAAEKARREAEIRSALAASQEAHRELERELAALSSTAFDGSYVDRSTPRSGYTQSLPRAPYFSKPTLKVFSCKPGQQIEWFTDAKLRFKQAGLKGAISGDPLTHPDMVEAAFATLALSINSTPKGIQLINTYSPRDDVVGLWAAMEAIARRKTRASEALAKAAVTKVKFIDDGTKSMEECVSDFFTAKETACAKVREHYDTTYVLDFNSFLPEAIDMLPAEFGEVEAQKTLYLCRDYDEFKNTVEELAEMPSMGKAKANRTAATAKKAKAKTAKARKAKAAVAGGRASGDQPQWSCSCGTENYMTRPKCRRPGCGK